MRVTATFADALGRPMIGRVEFTPTANAAVSGPAVLASATVTARLDGAGVLIGPDGTAGVTLTDTLYGYTAVCYLTSADGLVDTFTIPVADLGEPAVDLSTLTPPPPTPPLPLVIDGGAP